MDEIHILHFFNFEGKSSFQLKNGGNLGVNRMYQIVKKIKITICGY